MAKIDNIYDNVDDFGLITSAEAANLGMSAAEMVQQANKGKLVRVARGVYRMPVWPFQPQSPYAIAVKAAGDGAFLYGESVVALLGLAPTDPSKMWLASPKRCRRDLGLGTTVLQAGGTTPVVYEGISCQPLPKALAAAAKTMGVGRVREAARAALEQGFIVQEEFRELDEKLVS